MLNRHLFANGMKPLLALSIALTLSACAVGPDYRQPSVPTAPQFVERDTTFSDEHTVAQFWTQFDDATLNRLVSDALDANHDGVD